MLLDLRNFNITYDIVKDRLDVSAPHGHVIVVPHDEFFLFHTNDRRIPLNGFSLMHVTRLLRLAKRLLPGFKYEFEDNFVKFESLLLAAMWLGDHANRESANVYRGYILICRENDLTVHLPFDALTCPP